MTFDISNVGEKAPLEVVMARAATTTPGPGECTWLDRPLNANEPTRLHIEEQGSVQAACNAQGQCNIGQTTKHILAIINAIRGSGSGSGRVADPALAKTEEEKAARPLVAPTTLAVLPP
jgi:hypothetical protein